MMKRGVILTRFLRNVVRNRILRGDKYLLNFVTETDAKKYQQEKKEMKNFKKVETIDYLVTSEGKINLS